MTKINVPFVVRGQNIYQKAPPKRLSAGGQNYFFATFDFDETWKSIPYKKATFRLGKDAPIVVNIAESECVIPHEMMQKPGVFTVGVFGGDLLPTGTATVEVMEGVLTAGDDPEPPTPDWFDRIENRLDNLEEGGGGGGGGQDGYSPKAKVEKVGSVATITITDKSGTTTAEVHDGEPGERGEPGPAGADGKDYVLTGADKQTIATQAAGLVSVPVQSVNGKTGEVNLTAKDVGALPSDTQIPDPYTLPTASATTKGGVKVGDGLTVDAEGVLGVKQEQHIRTIQLDEISKIIVVDEDANGNPFELKKATIRCVVQPAEEVSSVNVLAYDSKLRRIVGRTIGSFINTSEQRTKIYLTKTPHGYDAMYRTSNSGNLYDWHDPHSASNDTISRFLFEANIVEGFPKGTTIEIWGGRS